MGLIYLDSCLLIYLAEGHAQWGAAVTQALAEVGDAHFGISPLVKSECLVGPLKRNAPVLEQAYLELFERLVPLAMPDTVDIQAAQLRACTGIRPRDALHLACAQQHRCDALWTNDECLAQVSHGLAVNILH